MGGRGGRSAQKVENRVSLKTQSVALTIKGTVKEPLQPTPLIHDNQPGAWGGGGGGRGGGEEPGGGGEVEAGMRGAGTRPRMAETHVTLLMSSWVYLVTIM